MWLCYTTAANEPLVVDGGVGLNLNAHTKVATATQTVVTDRKCVSAVSQFRDAEGGTSCHQQPVRHKLRRGQLMMQLRLDRLIEERSVPAFPAH